MEGPECVHGGGEGGEGFGGAGVVEAFGKARTTADTDAKGSGKGGSFREKAETLKF
jgi:hypothetical protein